MTRGDKSTTTKNRDLTLLDIDKMTSLKNKSIKVGDVRHENMKMAVDLSKLKDNQMTFLQNSPQNR